MMECHAINVIENDQKDDEGKQEGKQAGEMPSGKPLTKPYRPNMPPTSQAPLRSPTTTLIMFNVLTASYRVKCNVFKS